MFHGNIWLGRKPKWDNYSTLKDHDSSLAQNRVFTQKLDNSLPECVCLLHPFSWSFVANLVRFVAICPFRLKINHQRTPPPSPHSIVSKDKENVTLPPQSPFDARLLLMRIGTIMNHNEPWQKPLTLVFQVLSHQTFLAFIKQRSDTRSKKFTTFIRNHSPSLPKQNGHNSLKGSLFLLI